MKNWISLYPQWYINERNSISRSYPDFRVDEGLLKEGILCYFGELKIRISGGTNRQAIQLLFPDSTPYELPVVIPIESLPEFDDNGRVTKSPKEVFFDQRHQMTTGALCLFQRETRNAEGGETIHTVDVLGRAEEWFIGFHTGRWPPDSYESELETHFLYGGDILLSKPFYSTELTGSGRFFMARDMRRIIDAVSIDDPPFIVTVFTKSSEEGVEAVYDARENLECIFPWLGDEAWKPDKLIELEENRQTDSLWKLSTDHGYWWSLFEEPLPFHNGAGLLRELDKVAPEGNGWNLLSKALGAELTTRSEHYFALRYPGRSGGIEWLVLKLNTPNKRTASGGYIFGKDSEKQEEFKNASVYCFRVHGVRPEQVQLRNKGVINECVRDKTVALIGLGALGAKVAELLAQAGIGSFLLCDMDRLTTGNIARHVGGISDFGAKKTRVVKTRLHNINPHIKKIIIFDSSINSNMELLEKFIVPADIVISTTADENVESAINQIAVINRKTVVYGRAMRRGSMGRIFLVRPGEDACKKCIGIHAEEARKGEEAPEGWIAVSEREQDILLHECGRPVIPASAVDLSFVASLIARMSLDVLEGKTSTDNHWVWSREAASDVDPRFDKPFTTVSGSLPRLENCPACQEPDVTSVSLPKEIRDFIYSEVESSVDAETGGVLIGYVQGRKAFVTRATGPGPKAIKSATRFERDVEYVQNELERATSELGERGLYIGEWHSHLETAPKPSPTDITSLFGIAESTNYATRCPVMLIAGLNTITKQVERLKSWSFPISGRIYSIEYEVDN